VTRRSLRAARRSARGSSEAMFIVVVLMFPSSDLCVANWVELAVARGRMNAISRVL